jgi:hypothetical protein
MKIRALAFNTILLLALLASGCQSTEARRQSKEVTVLRLHLSSNLDGTRHTTTIHMPREDPMPLSIQANPFLDQAEILRAAVVDGPYGGYSIQLHFTTRGTFLLDTYSTANKDRKIAVYSQFDDEVRWLGAPVIHDRIRDGLLMFTPDASRDESERIVRGLNNVATRLHKERRF